MVEKKVDTFSVSADKSQGLNAHFCHWPVLRECLIGQIVGKDGHKSSTEGGLKKGNRCAHRRRIF